MLVRWRGDASAGGIGSNDAGSANGARVVFQRSRRMQRRHFDIVATETTGANWCRPAFAFAGVSKAATDVVSGGTAGLEQQAARGTIGWSAGGAGSLE